MSQNNKEKNTIVTQWGSTARPFSSYTEQEKLSVLKATESLLQKIKTDTGIDCFLSYGCLLGALRGGKLIGHDFDVDVVFLSKSAEHHEIVETARKLIEYLSDSGFHIALESNGQFKATWRSSNISYLVEFFVAWCEEDKLYQYFALKGANIASAILPLSTVELEGCVFPAPANSEALVEAIYGPNWRVPDPDFKYNLSAEDWLPFQFLFTRNNKNFWDTYYSEREKNAVFVTEPSGFSHFALNNLDEQSKTLIEFGCGNGRDGIFFAKQGIDVTLTDYSEAALEYCAKAAEQQGTKVSTRPLNIVDVSQSLSFGKANTERFDVVYSRFFLHAVNETGQRNFLATAHSILKNGGRLISEYRCIDKSQNKTMVYENGEHYRRLIDQDQFLAEARSVGFEVLHEETGYGLAKYKSEDPFIGRVVLLKHH